MTEIDVFYVGDHHINPNGAFSFKHENLLFNMLGYGVYLSDTLTGMLTYKKIHNRDIPFYKCSLIYKTEGFADLDYEFEMRALLSGIEAIYKEMKSTTSGFVKFKNKSECIAFWVEMYKQVYEKDTVAWTIREHAKLFKVIENELPLSLHRAILNQRFYCVSKEDNVNMITKICE